MFKNCPPLIKLFVRKCGKRTLQPIGSQIQYNRGRKDWIFVL